MLQEAPLLQCEQQDSEKKSAARTGAVVDKYNCHKAEKVKSRRGVSMNQLNILSFVRVQ